jgi:hypothetical protein
MASLSKPLLPRLYRVAAAYIVFAWLFFETVQETVSVLNERGWVKPAILAALAIGFLIASVWVWRLNPAYRFITRPIGRPLDVVLLIVLLAIIGLQSYRLLTPSLSDDIVDSRWLWVSVSSPGGDVAMPDCCTVQFEHRRWFAKPLVVVRTDCNDSSGPYTVGRYGGMVIGAMTGTTLPCIGPSGEALIGLVNAVRRYALEGDELSLETPVATVRLKRCTGPHVYEDAKAKRAGCV